MQFVVSHNVTMDDVVRAAQLARRRTDILLNIFFNVVIIGILSLVLHSFVLYLWAVVESPEMLVSLLRFETGEVGTAVLSWLSILVTLCLPVFLFYAIRSLVETLIPSLRIRRLMKNSDTIGPTTYIIDDQGVRSVAKEGAEIFLPWTAFDKVRCDTEMAVLMHRTRLKFFVPIEAFGRNRDAVLAEIKSRIPV